MASEDFGSVPGNEELKEWLADEIRGGTLGHAYIIEGASGSGKRLLAHDIAKAVLCEGRGTMPCGECAPCRKADAGSHPDIRVIGRGERASVGVDAVRQLRTDTHVIPSEAERKIYIIEDADTMTVEAQNAFLLSLEDPPEYVLYLLLCQDSKALLETIRSRAPSIRMRPCERGVIEEHLIRVGGTNARTLRDRTPERWAELLVCAGGNPGIARKLLEDHALDDRIEAKRRALSLITSVLSLNDDAVIGIAAMKKARRTDALELLADIESALRDMLLSKKSRAVDTCFFTSADDAAEAGSVFPARRIALALDAVRECGAGIEKNASVTTALLSMAIKIRNL